MLSPLASGARSGPGAGVGFAGVGADAGAGFAGVGAGFADAAPALAMSPAYNCAPYLRNTASTLWKLLNSFVASFPATLRTTFFPPFRDMSGCERVCVALCD
jgi:hypothetical protein